MLLFVSGDLALVHPRDGQFKVICQIKDVGFEIDDESVLCVSPLGDYGAIYQASDRNACVFDLHTGSITARIDRGAYRPENSHFPFAFLTSEGRTLLVAATDWNRLDIIDPATGTLLTARSPTSYAQGEQRPPRYLDYFHAQLLVSSDGNWIVDNGWFWGPWGFVRSWSMQGWRSENPWESEDGPTLKMLVHRAYHWDGPACWVDDSTIAIWGWGADDEWLIPAVRLFDVKNGNEIRWFPGPEARRPRAWPPKKLAPSLVFDEYLFSIHDQEGTAAWDIATGEQLLQDRTLAPVNYHPGSKEFLSTTSSGILLSTLTA